MLLDGAVRDSRPPTYRMLAFTGFERADYLVQTTIAEFRPDKNSPLARARLRPALVCWTIFSHPSSQQARAGDRHWQSGSASTIDQLRLDFRTIVLDGRAQRERLG